MEKGQRQKRTKPKRISDRRALGEVSDHFLETLGRCHSCAFPLHFFLGSSCVVICFDRHTNTNKSWFYEIIEKIHKKMSLNSDDTHFKRAIFNRSKVHSGYPIKTNKIMCHSAIIYTWGKVTLLMSDTCFHISGRLELIKFGGYPVWKNKLIKTLIFWDKYNISGSLCAHFSRFFFVLQTSTNVQREPPFLRWLTKSWTVSTFTPAFLEGGSSTLRIWSLGLTSTPRSSGFFFSIGFFFAFMMLGSVANLGSLRRRSQVTNAGSFRDITCEPPSTSRVILATPLSFSSSNFDMKVPCGQFNIPASIWP